MRDKRNKKGTRSGTKQDKKEERNEHERQEKQNGTQEERETNKRDKRNKNGAQKGAELNKNEWVAPPCAGMEGRTVEPRLLAPEKGNRNTKRSRNKQKRSRVAPYGAHIVFGPEQRGGQLSHALWRRYCVCI